ncbi:retrotransposon-related protein [Tanacetum coccineum]
MAWDVYEAAILQRFGAINEDPMAELKNLKYETTVKEYQSKFEKLINQFNITESQAISMFICGLPASIELNVRMFKPRSLTDAFGLAGLQETTLAALKKRNAPILTTPKTTSGWNANMSVTYPSKSTTTTLALPAPNNQTVTKYPASSVPTPRKMLSHKYEGQMFTLEIIGQEEEECLEKEEEEESDMIAYKLSNQTSQSSPYILLNALSGIPTHNTMRVRGHVLKQLLHILIDSGSTHNFLDIYMAKRLGCKIRNTCPLEVSVAGGSKLINVFEVHTELPPKEVLITRFPSKKIMLLSTLGLIDILLVRRILLRLWLKNCWIQGHLNKHTVKDKFPILMIEELIDKLQGAQWNPKAQETFEKLQQAMIQSPILALPNFDEEFVIETDASGIGLGAVLQQNKHLIAYLSKTLAPKHQSLSTYEKELLVMVLALQKLTTLFQSKWLPKLLGFDYEIKYKKGADNVAADALSRIGRQGVLFNMLAGTSNELMDAVIATWTSDSSLQAVIKGL